LHHTLHKNPDAVVALLDQSGYVKFVSDSIKNVTGHSPQEALGHHFTDFYSEPDSSHMAIAMQDCLLTGRSDKVTRAVMLKSGGTRRMRGDAWKLTDDDSGRIYVMSVSRPLEPAGQA
jgi:PAS domain S-box-containing protein